MTPERPDLLISTDAVQGMVRTWTEHRSREPLATVHDEFVAAALEFLNHRFPNPQDALAACVETLATAVYLLATPQDQEGA